MSIEHLANDIGMLFMGGGFMFAFTFVIMLHEFARLENKIDKILKEKDDKK